MAAVAGEHRTLLNTYGYLDTRGITAMKKKLTHCLTLRIPPELDLLISDASYDSRSSSKSAWIRRAIHAQLGEKRRTEPLYVTHAEAIRQGKGGA